MSGPGQCSTPPDCTGWPTDCSPAAPDADVAGLGVLNLSIIISYIYTVLIHLQIIISFCLSAFITLLLSVVLHFLLPSAEEGKLPPRKAAPAIIPSQPSSPHAPPQSTLSEPVVPVATAASPRSRRKAWSRILSKTILGLSDQQLASSLALLTIAFIRHCEISTYHLNLIGCLAWFSSVTHLSSVFALRHYWREERNAIALYTRIGLMFCVFILLLAVLTWSPQYSAGVGVGGCPAQCYWEIIDARNVFSGFFFFVMPNGSALVGLLQSIFVVWGYAICLTYVMPMYFRISKAVFWFLPGAVFDFLGSVLRRLRCTLPLRCLNQDRKASLVRLAGAIAEAIRMLWWNLCFPPPLLALLIQIASWCFGFVVLIVYRQGSHLVVADSVAEDQWGFGQVFAVFLVGVPLLTLLETWSETAARNGEYKGARIEPEVKHVKVPVGIGTGGRPTAGEAAEGLACWYSSKP